MAKRVVTDKDIIAAKERYKTMDRKEKMKYVWTYYKVQFVIGGLILFFLGFIINATFINPPKKNALSISFLDTTVNQTALDKMIPILNNALVEDTKRYAVESNVYYLQTNDFQLSSMLQQKIMAQYSIKGLDVFISAYDSYVPYAANGLFLDLESLYEEYLSGFETIFTECKEDGISRMYGIRLKDCKFLNDIGLRGSDVVLSMAVNSQNSDMLIPFLEYMYNY